MMVSWGALTGWKDWVITIEPAAFLFLYHSLFLHLANFNQGPSWGHINKRELRIDRLNSAPIPLEDFSTEMTVIVFVMTAMNDSEKKFESRAKDTGNSSFRQARNKRTSFKIELSPLHDARVHRALSLFHLSPRKFRQPLCGVPRA